MATREEAIAELYRRGALNPDQRAAIEELARRGQFNLPLTDQPTEVIQGMESLNIPDQMSIARQDALRSVAQDVGPLEAFLIGSGRGFATIGRGLGLMEPEDEYSRQAIEALKKERPYTTGAGEIAGTTAPFLAPGGAIAKLGSTAARIAAGGTLGATEGALIARGEGRDAGDIAEGAGVGAAIGAGAEILFPVIGRIGRQIYSRVRGTSPRGALLDRAGQPTPEFQSVLDESGITFEDLTEDAVSLLERQRPGANPEQASRAAEFERLGVPATTGDITQQFGQQATEQRLLQSAADDTAAPFRQFKLRQSRAIDNVLSEGVNPDLLPEETGGLIKDALEGRKNLLRTEKNQLYADFKEAAKGVGDIPIISNSIKDAIPEADDLEDLAITAPTSMKSLDGLLVRYGLKEPTEAMIEEGFSAVPLTASNFERFRKSINAIERGDQTGAIKVATGPIKEALDREMDELASSLSERGYASELTDTIKEARKRVKQIKTEFSPQSLVGKLVDVKKDYATNVTEASKVYNKLVAKSEPVENIRKVVGSLKQAGEGGEAALASLQSTTMLDLINAGFGTKSRKIDGVPVFNPIAFRNRAESIGKDKLSAIFKDNPAMLTRIKNIDKIAKYLTPPADAVPRGSAPVIMDALDRLGVLGLTSKIPGGGILAEQMQRLAQSGKTRSEVNQALASNPDLERISYMFDETFPGIATALGVGAISTTNREESQ